MLRACCFSMLLLMAPSAGLAADAPANSGANAALKYWQAFATLPRYTDAEHKRLDQSLTTPLDADARKMVARAEYALRMMYYGAAQSRCEWDLGNEEGLEHRMPHAEAARTMISLVCLRARSRFEGVQNRDAIDDVVALLTLGRHLSLDGSLISVIVSHRADRVMGETLATYLPQLDAKTLKDLKRRLDALPPCGSSGKALATFEIHGFDWWVDKVKDTADNASFRTCLQVTLDMHSDEVRDLIDACGGTKEGVLKMAEQTRLCFPLLANKLELPPDKFEKEWKDEEAKRADNPIFKRFFPAFTQMAWRNAQADVRRAMLSAAIAIQLDGRDALKKHPDPVVGGQFEHVPFEGGFELRSKVKGRPMDDQAVVLIVGRRGK